MAEWLKRLTAGLCGHRVQYACAAGLYAAGCMGLGKEAVEIGMVGVYLVLCLGAGH